MPDKTPELSSKNKISSNQRYLKPYDFTQEHSLSEELKVALEQLFHQYAKRLSLYLSNLKGIETQVTLLSAERMSFEVYHQTLDPSCYWTTMYSSQLPFFGSIAIDSELLNSAIHSMLGDFSFSSNTHLLNNLELALCRKFFQQLVDEMNPLISPLISDSLKITEVKTDPDQSCTVMNYEKFLVADFYIQTSVCKGQILLAISNKSLMNIGEKHSHPLSLISTSDEKPFQSILDPLPIGLTAILEAFTLTQDELNALQPGDAIVLKQKLQDPIYLKIGEDVMYKAFPGLRGKHKGIMLSKSFKQSPSQGTAS